MFRASDIFGRRPGATSQPAVTAKAGVPVQKRPLSAVGPHTRTWDPATGKYVEEELPVELQELMGLAPKRVKAEQNGHVKQEAWGQSKIMKALGPSAVGLAPVKGGKRMPTAEEIDLQHPSVEYKGFSKVDLNDRYYEKTDLQIHGKPTYWTADAQFFLYWQGEVKRWSICDAASLFAVRAGQYPGWAYKEDHKHLCQASGWMEAWGGEWKEPALEVTYRSPSTCPPQWVDPQMLRAISVVEFHGFAMKELNTRYFLKASEHVQGKPTFWDDSGVYFIYWQRPMKRWAICDLKCFEAVKQGQCPGWAYRSDDTHLANACGWMERRSDQWAEAILETSVIAICTQGLKVEFWGFAKEELNTQYTERADEEVQGRATFWDPSDNYFIYWQSSMARWAICDRASLSAAKSGLAPGWAYRTDSQHFTRSRGWMEVWGRDWKRANINCTVLEGNVKDDFYSAVKAEAGEGTEVSASVYKHLVRRVYEAKNPTKLEDLERILEKYQGKEKELYQNVCEKYGVDAGGLLAQDPNAAGDAADGEEAQEGDAVDEADLEHADLPQLSAQEYAIHIQNIYVAHNPKKLQDIGALLAKFRQKEAELYAEVCKKYGEHPAKYHARHEKTMQQQMRVKSEAK